jgi:hypothetical protein
MSLGDAGPGAQLARCAVHPARRASDACPVCGRGRCAPDAASFRAAGCAACVDAEPAPSPTPVSEWLLRAALAAIAVAYAGAWVAAQYVDTQYFAVIVPGLVGLACAWTATAAAGGTSRGGSARILVLIAAVAAVLGTALSDRLVPGGQNLFVPAGHRLPPYLAAVVGAFAWPVLFGPPRPRRSGVSR